MRRDAADRPAGEAGFTLLEVLAAVAVAGFALSAIGSLVAVTFAGIRSAADRVALTETGRTLLDGLPRGETLRPGATTGTMGTTRWRIDVAPVGQGGAVPRLTDGKLATWTTAAVTISARTQSGRSLRLDTVGLIQSDSR